MKLTKRNISATLLFIGAIIRGHGLPVPAIWYDEAFSLELTRLSLPEMIRVQAMDFNPPLWEMLLMPFVKISDSLIMIRLPSLLASLGSLYLLWLIMDELEFTDNQRILTSLLAGLLPGTFLIAQDARVYALLALMYMAGTLFALRGQLLGLTAVSGLMLYSHTTAGAFLVGLYLLAWYRHPGKLKAIIISGVSVIISWLPWLPNILSTSHEFWLYPLNADSFMTSSLRSVWAESLPGGWEVGGYILMLFYALVGLFITVSYSFPQLYQIAGANVHQARAAIKSLGTEKIAARLQPPTPPKIDRADKPIIPTGIVTVIPLAIMIVISLIYANVIFYRPLTSYILPMSLWLGATTAPKEIKLVKMIWPVAWIVLILVALVNWDPAVKGAGMDLVVQHVKRDLQPGDVVFYATGTAALPVEYYLNVDHESYIMDSNQHPALLRNDIQDMLGYKRAKPDEVDPDFVFVPCDPLMPDQVNEEINSYLTARKVVSYGRVEYWQAADIEVYKLE